MLQFDIPGQAPLTIEHVVLDLNGTIARDNEVLPGVGAALASLSTHVHTVLVTADTHGTAAGFGDALGIDVRVIRTGEWEAGEKLAVVTELGPDHVFAVGNGANDALMLKSAAVGVAIVGPEGAARACVESADVVVTTIADALGLLLHPARLVATLRT
jgi:P-type E1-E2 ATPase